MNNKVLALLWIMSLFLTILLVLIFQHLSPTKTNISTPNYFGDGHSIDLSEYQLSKVLTNSMLPTFPINSTIITVQVKQPEQAGVIILYNSNAIPLSEIQKYDIICFNLQGYSYPLCHRVLDIRNSSLGEQFLTKGDNDNLIGDAMWINSLQVVSKVVGVFY